MSSPAIFFWSFVVVQFLLCQVSHAAPLSAPFGKYPIASSTPTPFVEVTQAYASPADFVVLESGEPSAAISFAPIWQQEAGPQQNEDEEEEDDKEAEASKQPDPAATAESKNVCVDATYLNEYLRRDLVHAEHVWADVLCPANSTLPCGTTEHGVLSEGTLISYAALCQRPGMACSKTRMLVNSVLSNKWPLQQHITGRMHSSVQLTMFDVRHPPRVQLVLHSFISFGRYTSSVMRLGLFSRSVLHFFWLPVLGTRGHSDVFSNGFLRR